MKINFVPLLKVFLLVFFFTLPLSAQDVTELYASAEEENILVLEPSFATTKRNTVFGKKYHYLVARAYFKLLAQAQKSERELRSEYEKYFFQNEKFSRKGSQSFQNKLDIAFKKYHSHSAMLSGLKSWNLFSEDRTGDMFYFMAENEDHIYKMYHGKLAEDKMVKYLIYKLADLYHVEGEK